MPQSYKAQIKIQPYPGLHMNVVPRSTKNTNGETENYLWSVNLSANWTHE